jgi:hypothetical protein
MFHRWAALLLVLALCAISPKNAAGQSSSKPRGQGASGLGSYPNPFNPEVFFTVHVPKPDDVCTDQNRQYAVTLKIYNVLGQPIATAQFRGANPKSTTPAPAGANGQLFSNLRLGCGEYLGYWSGKMDGTGKEAASGVYIARQFIDGKPTDALRIFLSK